MDNLSFTSEPDAKMPPLLLSGILMKQRQINATNSLRTFDQQFGTKYSTLSRGGSSGGSSGGSHSGGSSGGRSSSGGSSGGRSSGGARK